MRIDVALVDTVPLGVDTPADLARARELLGARLTLHLSPSVSASSHDRSQAPEIAFQGEPGANSHLACRDAYPDMEALPCATFEDALAAVKSGEAALAMIPIENSVAGRVADIHHLLPDSGLYIVGEHFERIRHQLLALPGVKLAELKTVHSHTMALGQCRKVIRALKLKPIAEADTAGAARQLRESQGPHPRGDRLGARRRDLRPLDRQIRHRGRVPQHHALRRARREARPRQAGQAGRSSPPSSSACATCRRRSTRRWAASPPTAST